MPAFFQRLLLLIKSFYHRVVELSQPVFGKVKPYWDKTVEYLRTHPKARRRLIIFGPPLFFLFLLLLTVWIETPSKRQLRNIQNQVASEVYSADSVLLGRYYLQDRTEVKYNEIAPVVFEALVATEDNRFYEHEGVDFYSLGRVLVKSIFMQDESSGGGSTLTQQLSKNLYPRKNYWILSMLINKLREIITATRLEGIYSKEELITMYLNTVPFADNTFGIQAASLRFFSVPADSLSADKAAVLIGMLKATHYYNPRLFPDRSETRRNVVLGQMVKYKYLKKEAADSIKQIPLVLNYNKVSHHHGLAPYFREYMKGVLMDWCATHEKEDGSPYNLYTDGLKIYTTINSKLQQYAEDAVTKQMTDLQQQFYEHWGKQKPWHGKEEVLEEAIRRSPRYQKLLATGMNDDEIMVELQKPVPMKFFNWKGVEETVASPIDSIIHHLQFLNAGFLAMDPKSGAIQAWVGGIDHDFYQYDHVKITTKRQVGSIFKPIVYAQAIEDGIEPCELIPAYQQTYIDKEGDKWTPRNTQNDYQVEYTMRGGLAYSVNTVAVKLIDRVGVNKTMALAQSMGIKSEIPDVPSIALGSTSISLFEMTGAYGCLANDGVAVTPYYVDAIYDLDGKVFTDLKPAEAGKRILSSETVQLVTDLLKTVIHEGTASRLRWRYGVYNLDVAGKTGTTQANADGWFMCYTPNLVIGSWVGADDPRIRFRYTKLGQGSSTALPITGYFLKSIEQDKSFEPWLKNRFTTLPSTLREKLDCDLYELSDTLQYQIARSLAVRDSLILADTSVTQPEETFLQVIYKRKLKIQRSQQTRDSINMMESLRSIEIGG